MKNKRKDIINELGNLLKFLEGLSRNTKYDQDEHRELINRIDLIKTIEIIDKPLTGYQEAYQGYNYWLLTEKILPITENELIEISIREREIQKLKEQISNGYQRNGYIDSLLSQKKSLEESIKNIKVEHQLIDSCERQIKTLQERQEIYNIELNKQRNINNINNLKEQIKQMDKKLSNMKVPNYQDQDLVNIRKQIELLNKSILVYESNLKYTRIKNEILKKEQDINHNLSQEIQEKQKDFSRKIEEKSDLIKYQEIKSEYNSIKLLETRLKKSYGKISSLSKLKQIATETEYEQLESVVASINSTLSEILTSIFEEPITVSLKLFKELKTAKRIKPIVNLQIDYKGVSYDNVNNLSGGEGDRISLALLVAINKLSGSPFILLDECISSLNQSVRTQCIETIRSYLNYDSICIVINHEDVEGIYDKVVKI